MFRIKEDITKLIGELGDTWDEHPNLDDEEVWDARYTYEKELIIQQINFNSVLEIGCGAGKLSQLIQKARPRIKYHMIDQQSAYKQFKKRNYKGTFFIQNLENNFNIDDLDDHYDLIISNDFLEHIRNPSMILKQCHKMMNEESSLFISIPNWRMGHVFIYKGLFHFDNFLHFAYIHGFDIEVANGSFLKTPLYTKLESESLLPDEIVNSWNIYMKFQWVKLQK